MIAHYRQNSVCDIKLQIFFKYNGLQSHVARVPLFTTVNVRQRPWRDSKIVTSLSGWILPGFCGSPFPLAVKSNLNKFGVHFGKD